LAEALIVVAVQVPVLAPQRDPKIAKFLVNLRGRGDRARHFFVQQCPIAATKAMDDRL
jgi:hypothetical protein